MIVANHAHVYPEELLEGESTPQHYKHYWRHNKVTLEHLSEHMEMLGIDRAVAFPPLSTPDRHPEFNAAQWIAEAVKSYPRITGYGTVRVHNGNYEGQVREIYALGLTGIKVHASVQQLDLGGSEAYKLYEACEKYDIVVDAHTGPHGYRLRHDSDPFVIDELLWEFPKLTFVIEHLGGFAFHRQMCAVIANVNRRAGRVRVYGGLTPSNFLPVSPQGTMPELTDEELVYDCQVVRPDALIMGLDFPHHSVEDYRKMMHSIQQWPIDREAKDAILGDNLTRLLERPRQ